MIDRANEMKLAASGILAALTACRSGSWNSAAARDGIWHKLGSILAVLVAGLMDLVLGVIVNCIPQIILPFEYGVFLCPVVLVWYIVTELGSMVENAERMGAPVPEFLRKAIGVFEDAAK